MTAPVPVPAPAGAVSNDADLRYPIGKLSFPDQVDTAWRREAIETIAATPARLESAVAGWDDARLDTPYRPGGWTVRQLVHHLADSHLNAYVRFKLALTEPCPAIKGYDEAAWAELADTRLVPIGVSLAMLNALHTRWAALLQAMTEQDFQRTLVHPKNGVRTLDQMLATYAWHGSHHLAHVTRLSERQGW